MAPRLIRELAGTTFNQLTLSATEQNRSFASLTTSRRDATQNRFRDAGPDRRISKKVSSGKEYLPLDSKASSLSVTCLPPSLRTFSNIQKLIDEFLTNFL